MKPFDQLADDQSIEAVKVALAANNIESFVVENSAEAKAKFLELLTPGVEVMNMTSKTLDQTGILEAMTAAGHKLVKDEIAALDPTTDHRKRKQLGAAPEWAVGSLHAITEDGHLLWASATGSQLPAYAYGADHIILVASTKKIVANTEEGMKRIYEYSLVLESERAKIAYGVAGSSVNRMLIINREPAPGRITLILVKEDLGF